MFGCLYGRGGGLALNRDCGRRERIGLTQFHLATESCRVGTCGAAWLPRADGGVLERELFRRLRLGPHRPGAALRGPPQRAPRRAPLGHARRGASGLEGKKTLY